MRTAPEALQSNPKKLKPMALLATVRLEGGVSSVAVEGAVGGGGKGRQGARGGGSGGGGAGFTMIVGTKASNIYRVVYDADARK
jgi:hypothetical protein